MCKRTYKKSITPGVIIWVAAFKIVCLSKTKSLKIYDIWKLHFASLRRQTACFEELVNQRKIWLKYKIYLLYRYWWNTRIFPFTEKSYLHRTQWRYYFYLSRARILVSPWLLTWLANYRRASRSGAQPVLLKFHSQKVVFYAGISSVSIK